MPDFALPAADNHVFGLVQLLDVGFDVSIPEARLDAFSAALDGKPSEHAKFVGSCNIGAEPAEISAVIGVHLDHKASDGSPDRYIHAHVRLERRVARPASLPNEDKWCKFVELLHGVLEDSPAAVNLRLLVPREGAVTAVPLPIPFGHELSGFSQIRGVQLAELDPDDQEKTLYSAILQLTNDAISVDVSMPAALRLDAHVFEAAFAKSINVAKLAIPSII